MPRTKSRYPIIKCDYVDQLLQNGIDRDQPPTLSEALQVICFAESAGLEKHFQMSPSSSNLNNSKSCVYNALLKVIQGLRSERIPDLKFCPELSKRDKAVAAELLAERNALQLLSDSLSQLERTTELATATGLWLGQNIRLESDEVT